MQSFSYSFFKLYDIVYKIYRRLKLIMVLDRTVHKTYKNSLLGNTILIFTLENGPPEKYGFVFNMFFFNFVER